MTDTTLARRRGGHAAAQRARRGKHAASSPAAEVELEIARIGEGGDGIAETAGGRVYVPWTLAGDRVKARLGASRGDGRAAELLAILSPGAGRSEPPCPHFGRCGGCALQHLDSDLYIGWKLERLRRALARVGLGDCVVAPVARTPPGARRRATFTAERHGRKGFAVAGFSRRLSHDVVDVTACPVLDPRLPAILPSVRRLLADRAMPARAMVAAAVLDGALDIVVQWPGEPTLAMRERLAKFALETAAARLSWRPAAGAPAETILQCRPLGAMFGGVFVPLPVGAFVQASAEGERALVAEVQGALGGAGAVADLFAGAGTFGLPLAVAGARVLCVDAGEASLRALAAAVRTHPPLAQRLVSLRRDLFVRPMTAAELERFDAAIFDPPRAGAAAQAAQLARSRVPVVAAVSCNPATFARDARILVDGGYRLARVLPVDQFLWSPHLELVGMFTRGA